MTHNTTVVTWEGSPSVASAGCGVRVSVGLRVNLLRRCALACPFQIWGEQWVLYASMSNHGSQRSWECLRLVTKQGKQLALNSERIASLYRVEGYRLALHRDS